MANVLELWLLGNCVANESRIGFNIGRVMSSISCAWPEGVSSSRDHNLYSGFWGRGGY